MIRLPVDLPLQAALWAIAAMAGLAAWLLTTVAGGALLSLWERVRLYRGSALKAQMARYERGERRLPDALLYGYPDLPWPAIGLGLAGAACAALYLVVGLPYALFAVVLERVPYLLRGMLQREGKQRLRLLVRDFVDDLREAEAIHGSLGKALDALVEAAVQGKRADPVAAVLVYRTRARTAQVTADQVLAQMAADLRSEEMQEVAGQVRLALAGGMRLSEALEAVGSTLSDVIAAEVNVRLQAAPNTYVLPMVIFMFGPLMALMLYPLVLRIVGMLAGGGGL